MIKFAVPAVASFLLAAGAAGAAQASDDCNVPQDQWQPQQALQQKLEAEGWTVRSIEVDDGCYEVYGLNADGQHMEAEFDPQTLALLDDEMVDGEDD